jgi:hypothetical protein
MTKPAIALSAAAARIVVPFKLGERLQANRRTSRPNISWAERSNLLARRQHRHHEFGSANEEIGYEVSDEALEAAAGTYMRGQSIMTVGMTIVMSGCC